MNPTDAIVNAFPATSALLQPDVELEHTADHMHLLFNTPRPVLSSAVLGGGLVKAHHLLNLKVSAECSITRETPATTLLNYCNRQHWSGTSVGMMTAASMKSLRIAEQVEQDVAFTVLATTGIANARCAGDPAEWHHIDAGPRLVGTINTVFICSANLTEAAMVEAITTATEAKAVALRQLSIASPVSANIATGTGTDAIAIVGGTGPQRIDYFGKHVIAGELLAKLMIEAITESLQYEVSDSTSTEDHPL